MKSTSLFCYLALLTLPLLQVGCAGSFKTRGTIPSLNNDKMPAIVNCTFESYDNNGNGSAELATGTIRFMDPSADVMLTGTIDAGVEATIVESDYYFVGFGEGTYEAIPKSLGGGNFAVSLIPAETAEALAIDLPDSPFRGNTFVITITSGPYAGYEHFGTVNGSFSAVPR